MLLGKVLRSLIVGRGRGTEVGRRPDLEI